MFHFLSFDSQLSEYDFKQKLMFDRATTDVHLWCIVTIKNLLVDLVHVSMELLIDST